MLNKITMPSAGQTTDSMTIARWCKAAGDPVARGDVLFEVETDKAVLPVESFAKGTLLKILVPEGEKATVGDVVAYVGNEGDLEKATPAAASSAAASVDDDDYAPVMPGPAPARSSAPAAVAVAGAARPAMPDRGKGFVASPAAKKAARDAGVSLADVFAASGVSPLRRRNVLDFAAAGGAGEAGGTLLPLTAMRRIIAARMSESAATIPAYTVEIEVDMTALAALREKLKARGDKVALHDLFAKCVAGAAVAHPMVNASWTERGIMLHNRVHVGIAVAVDNGLVVPVVRDAGNKPVTRIAVESTGLVARARAGTLQPDDMKGGTITVSNLGAYPISRFTAIINPPESCILAIGGTSERPVLEDGELVFKPIATITASFDHRVVDGAYGAAFLADLKTYIEDPALMLC